MSHVEVELKFPLLNPDVLLQFLEQHGERIKTDVWQKDAYYNFSHRNFLATEPVVEWLRIRESQKGSDITYKHWYHEKDYCDEYETTVGNADMMSKIFLQLDLTPLIVVDKVRNERSYQGAHIAIDIVQDLGCFIELEIAGDFADTEPARKILYALLEQIPAEVGKQEKRGYPYMLLSKRGLV